MHLKSTLRILRYYLSGILLIAAMNNSIQAQSEKPIRLKGKTELAGAFSFQYMKQKDASEGSWILNLPVQTRYFVTQNIGIGAELIFTDGKGEGSSGLILNGILEVAFPTPNGVIPFLNAGYGISNGSLIVDRLAIKNYDNVTFGVLNLGGGVRVPFGEKVYGKIELRYQRFTGEYKYDSFFGSSQTFDVSTNYLNALFGLSLLL